MEHFYSFINIPVDIDNHTDVGYTRSSEKRNRNVIYSSNLNS